MSSGEHLLIELKKSLAAPKGVRDRVMKRVATRIAAPGVLKDVQGVLTPNAEIAHQVWVRILQSIDADRTVVALLDRLRGLLTPSREFMQNLKYSVMPRLVPVQVVPIERRVLQWVAAFCLVLFLAQLGPQLLIAPRTVAQSEVTLLPMRGEVAVSVGGLWQPVAEEITLEPGMVLRTRLGEASILFRDDAVVRLDANTTIELIDTSDRADMHSSAEETISLMSGRIWVQGLIPSHLRAIDIKTARGFISVFEGSVSVQQGEGVDVSVWDRGARVTANGSTVYLVAGERTRLEGTGPLVVKNVSEDAYESRWVMQNLERDAVHRRSIAQMQQERRAARAGILPTSSLYPVKRLAEAMDELLTLGEEARTQKRLDHADTRLDEAAALIQEGKLEEGKVPLADYHKSLVALASGSGDTIVQSLIQQSIARASSDMAAVLPDDSAYLIKEAVLEAGSSMPQVAITTADVQGMLLLDTISALLRKVDEGGIAEVGQTWTDFQKYLAVLDDPQSDLTPEVRKEARVLLSEFAFAVTQIAGQSSEIDPAFVKEVAAYLPPEMDAAVSVLSEEQVMSIVQAIRARIFTFDMARSRINQLNGEFKALEGHPDQGRILRRLYFELPEGPEHFPELVRREIVRLQWALAVTAKQ